MYKEYLAEFWYSAKTLENSKVFFSTPIGGIYGKVGVNTFRNAIGASYLSHSNKLVTFKALKSSSNVERVPQETKPGAKPGQKKHSISSKQPFVSNKEATKVSTPMDTGIHKEDQQATGGPTSLGVTSEARANPQLSSGMSVFNLNEPIYLASFIIHFESASRNDASSASTAKSNLRNSAPSDFVPQQQGMNEGTKNTSYDHLFAGAHLHVLVDQTKSVSEGLETVLTQPIIGKGASLVSRQIEEETSSTIKLEDLAKLVSHVQPSFKDLDSPEDDLVIVADDSDKDKDDEVHATQNVKTKDTSVPKSLSLWTSQTQELTNQVLILQSQKHKLELEKNKAKAKAALLKAQPSFPNLNPSFPMWNSSRSCW
nr:hypothetical protein [Tanacetum cinerariifolium]